MSPFLLIELIYQCAVLFIELFKFPLQFLLLFLLRQDNLIVLRSPLFQVAQFKLGLKKLIADITVFGSELMQFVPESSQSTVELDNLVIFLLDDQDLLLEQQQQFCAHLLDLLINLDFLTAQQDLELLQKQLLGQRFHVLQRIYDV